MILLSNLASAGKADLMAWWSEGVAWPESFPEGHTAGADIQTLPETGSDLRADQPENVPQCPAQYQLTSKSPRNATFNCIHQINAIVIASSENPKRWIMRICE